MNKDNMLATMPKVFIEKYAEYLRTKKEFVVPASFKNIKTGVGKVMPPSDPDWGYTRAASMVRQIYLSENGMSCKKLRKIYGCKKNRGTKPERKSLGSGSVIRRLLQALEKAGVIAFNENKYRVIAETGMKEIDSITNEFAVPY